MIGRRFRLAVGPAPFGLVGRDLIGRGMLRLDEGLDLELVGHVDGLVIQLDIVFEAVRDRRLFKDRLPRAVGLAGDAIDTFVGMDIEHVGEVLAVVANIFVNAIDRAYADASGVDAINTEPGYRPWHSGTISPARCENQTILPEPFGQAISADGANPSQVTRSFCHTGAEVSTH